MESKKSLIKSPEISDFDKFSQNLDVLKYFFQFLEIGDQLSFANVSPQLQFVYRNFICQKWIPKKIKIKKYSETIQLKYYNEQRLKINLSFEEYDYFLRIYGLDVEQLSESHGSALNLTPNLNNLTCIKYNFLLITKEQIQLLTQMCPQLETLSFLGCCNSKHKLLRLGFDIEVQHLLSLKKLKTFSLRSGLMHKVKYGPADDFIKKAKLPMDLSNSMENLDIYMPTLNTQFMGLFTQLQSLSITLFHPVTNQDIIALGVSCQRLKTLTFHYASFEVIENFSILSNLNQLSLYHCDGLTYDNLRQILTELPLVTFTSIETKYKGIFHYYFLAPTIKSIYIDAIKPFDFKTEFEFYKSLREK
ncbi:uncharacterized protein LOC119614026 [Lucilia sericata]|uniref:uncharacterized protein LOC119614026 n=1 Tax=Lucilia sericata TaxID=13632 RepID=UPI0018A876DA|nr:uncharacterized protein LOC119614026 [Lucilia sericata]